MACFYACRWKGKSPQVRSLWYLRLKLTVVSIDTYYFCSHSEYERCAGGGLRILSYPKGRIGNYGVLSG